MAVAKMSFFGGSSITGHLLIIAKKTTTPLIEEARLTFPPPVNTHLNIEFTNLAPVPHTIEFRQSPDGSALGTLLTTFIYDVKNQVVSGQKLFYRVDGIRSVDPASGQPHLTDPALDGKTISGVFKEGFRYLVAGEEYNPKAGGGVSLLSGLLWSPGEVVTVDITFLANVPSGTSGSDDADYKLITADTTLDINYRNSEIHLEGSANRLTVTLEVISNMPEGTKYKFCSYGGEQRQTKIITQIGNLIRFNNADVTSLVIGQNEYLTIVKRGAKFRVTASAAGFNMVGERFSSQYLNHTNAIPADDRLVDGDDIPRLYDWLKNTLPANHKVTTTNALIASFARPVDKPGAFIVCSDSKRFRMPNWQGLVEKGLKDFDAPGTDATRLWDYPGGLQNDQIGPHWHDTAVQNKDTANSTINPTYNRGKAKPSRRWNSANGTDTANSSTDINTLSNGDYATENLVKTGGVIYQIRT